MIVHLKEIISQAQKKKFAVGAFNTSNLEVTLGIVAGAVKMKSPVIIQISESTIKYAGLKNIFNLINSIAETDGKDIPIAIHLDHGKNWEIVKDCILIGLSSVHFDGSAFPFEKNVRLTKRAVEFAHRHGVFCQGELGSLPGREGLARIIIPKNHDSFMTNPEQAREFVAKTSVDTLAVSVGSLHGIFKGQEKIDFERLSKIQQQVKLPLVLHGGSGVKDEEIKRAIKLGIRIINIDTSLRLAFTKTLKQTVKATKSFYDPRKILAPSIIAVAEETADRIKVFGSRL